MSQLHQWAIKWAVPAAALHDLQRTLGMLEAPHMPEATAGTSEAAVSNRLRLAASRMGGRLWRNNVGALVDDRGVPLRYGLANDSAALNRVIKSADLIGIYPLQVTADMVGSTVGQFWSIEAKQVGWSYTGRGREAAQSAWAQLVVSLGGRACFATDEGQM